ncbi:MAG: quinolinate synthase [Elusimicrobia bacterium]|nr:quinolinate synthase [Elusimicrobiota bacterium]
MTNLSPSPDEIKTEAERLREKGLLTLGGYTEDALIQIAQKTWRINQLKKAKNAVIPAHVYQRAEIILGISDFSGDSYRLSKMCTEVKAATIVFCGVRFMAETAKILNPEKTVILPALEAGCSLAEAVKADDVRRLREQNPGLPIVCYINTTADVKAECDVVVTSANAAKILKKLYEKHPRIIFLPDELMGKNLARELNKTVGKEIIDGAGSFAPTRHPGESRGPGLEPRGCRGLDSGPAPQGSEGGDTASGRGRFRRNDETENTPLPQMIIWNGKCIVHEWFDASWVERYRKEYPGIKILVHTECAPALVEIVDFAGGTGDMMKYVANTEAPHYMLVTECGLGELARLQFPQKKFIPMCHLCPYMKAIDLDRVEQALVSPQKDQIIEVPETIRVRAKKALDAMFLLA